MNGLPTAARGQQPPSPSPFVFKINARLAPAVELVGSGIGQDQPGKRVIGQRKHLPAHGVNQRFLGQGRCTTQLIERELEGIRGRGSAQGVVEVVAQDRLPGPLKRRLLFGKGDMSSTGKRIFGVADAGLDPADHGITADGMHLKFAGNDRKRNAAFGNRVKETIDGRKFQPCVRDDAAVFLHPANQLFSRAAAMVAQSEKDHGVADTAGQFLGEKRSRCVSSRSHALRQVARASSSPAVHGHIQTGSKWALKMTCRVVLMQKRDLKLYLGSPITVGVMIAARFIALTLGVPGGFLKQIFIRWSSRTPPCCSRGAMPPSWMAQPPPTIGCRRPAFRPPASHARS